MLGILDSVIIVISLALVVGAVLRAAGKKETDAEYFLAGRDLRWPFIGMSLLASNISAEHVVGLAGDGYRVGMVTGGYEWMAAWCLIILAALFTPLYLRNKIYTIPEFLERRFGWGQKRTDAFNPPKRRISQGFLTQQQIAFHNLVMQSELGRDQSAPIASVHASSYCQSSSQAEFLRSHSAAHP